MPPDHDDTDRDPESSYCDSSHNDHDDSDIATPSPIEESSQDEYIVTPTKNGPPGSVYSTPTTRSGHAEQFSQKTRDAFKKLCKKIYHGNFCLLTQEADPVQIAHVIPRATKASVFKLYEYCLGLKYKNLHVNSRSNLFNLSPTWHTRFDQNNWFLLPDAQTLDTVHQHIRAVIKQRSEGIEPLDWPKRKVETLTKYTFIPVFDGFITRIEKGKPITHTLPHHNLPLLECHIFPPYAVINAGQKLRRDQVDEIARGLDAEQTTNFTELKQRLTVLCDIWDLFTGARDAAEAWKKPAVGDNTEAVGGMKRKHSDSGQTNRRSTRSKSEHGGHRKCERSPNSIGDNLTEKFVSGIKRQRTDDWKAGINRWIKESTGASMPYPQ